MKKLFYFMLSLVAFVGCTENETDNTNNNQGGGNTEPSKTELTVNVTDLSFDAEADVKSIDISSSDAWTAEFVNDRASEWCSLSPTSGQAGNSSILVNVTENNSGEDRSASIIIKAKSLQKIVKVTQKQNDAITVTSSKFEVKAEGGEVEIEVKANVDYDYSIEESAKSWVTYKTTRAMESSTLVFDVAENSNIEKREAKITLKSGDIKEVVTIYQEGMEYAIILSKNEYTVSDKGETIAVEVKSNVDVAVEIPSDVDWVKENSTRAMSTNTYYFEVSPNEDYNSRSTAIKFTNKENNLAETVTITQAQKDAIVIAKDNYTINYAGGEIDIEVGHNVDFDVEISDNWITKTSTRAFETETLIFSIAANNTTDIREGTVKFTSKDNSITQVVTINQKAALPAKNEIFYTTIDGKIIELDGPSAFAALIVSNTYVNGVGVIVCDREITEIAGAFRECYSLTSVTIPDSVTEIGALAFRECIRLQSITIPNSVTEIGWSAFEDCTSLTSVTIGNNVTSIGSSAFNGCSRLQSITIPNSETQIGKYAFSGCDRLTSMTIHDSVDCSPFAFGSERINILHIHILISTLTSFCDSQGIDTRLTTKIQKHLYINNVEVIDITIPNSVTKIGNNVFMDCHNLKSVTIPDSVTEIGGYAFCHCSSLTSITIPDSVIKIGYDAFSVCSSLTSVTIGNSVTSIGDFAFHNCSSLESITIPDSVTEIGHSAFCRCSSLTSITIPDSVTEIGGGAFENCQSLTKAVIGIGVKEIGSSAFENCISLNEVLCKPITPPTAVDSPIDGEWDAFKVIGAKAKIYVPRESVEAYKTANGWKDYADIIVGYDF